MGTEKVVLVACGSFNPITNMHLRMFELARDHLTRTTQYEVVAGFISPACQNYLHTATERASSAAPQLSTSNGGGVSVDQRCEMIQLAIGTSDWLLLDRWEADQVDWSPTRVVLDEVARRVRSRPKEVQGEELKKRRNLIDKTSTEPDNQQPLEDWLVALLEDKGLSISQDLSSNTHRQHQEGSHQQIVSRTCGDIRVMLLCGSELLQSFSEPDLWHPEDLEIILRDYGLVCIIRPDFDPRQLIYESEVLHRYERNIHLVTEWMTNEVSSARIRRSLRRGENVRFLLPDPVINYILRQRLYDCRQPAPTMPVGARGEGDLITPPLPPPPPLTELVEELPCPVVQDRPVRVSQIATTSTVITATAAHAQGLPHHEVVTRECQTRLSALGRHSLLVDTPSPGSQPPLTTASTPRPCRSSPPPPIPAAHLPLASADEGRLEMGEEAILRLIKECSLCGSRRVRLMIVEGLDTSGGSGVTTVSASDQLPATTSEAVASVPVRHSTEVGLIITRLSLGPDRG